MPLDTRLIEYRNTKVRTKYIISVIISNSLKRRKYGKFCFTARI
jgi:hypothetical protein